ncbi:MAG: energy transducer TonB [Proteobacteria bacterium]|nr:energy transducer TonB [Pseudomonadota bacterium]NOG60853.1 energy transducer TonB [Pseudomonadota bacterium]
MQFLKINIHDFLKTPFLIIIALSFNIAIFILIQQLVNKDHKLNIKLVDVNLIEFIRFERKPEPPKQKKEIEDIEQPPPEQEPPPPDVPEPQMEKPQAMEMDLSLPEIDIPLSLSGTPYLGDFAKSTKKGKTIGKPAKPAIDTNVVPTLRIPPVYPARALRSGIEGVVTVEFTIAIDGSVKDPVIVKSKPPKIFDKAVMKSITKWKFNPDMVDGKPAEKRARQDVKFKLQR